MTHSEITAIMTIDELLKSNPSEKDLNQLENFIEEWAARIKLLRQEDSLLKPTRMATREEQRELNDPANTERMRLILHCVQREFHLSLSEEEEIIRGLGIPAEFLNGNEQTSGISEEVSYE